MKLQPRDRMVPKPHLCDRHTGAQGPARGFGGTLLVCGSPPAETGLWQRVAVLLPARTASAAETPAHPGPSLRPQVLPDAPPRPPAEGRQQFLISLLHRLHFPK